MRNVIPLFEVCLSPALPRTRNLTIIPVYTMKLPLVLLLLNAFAAAESQDTFESSDFDVVSALFSYDVDHAAVARLISA